MKKRKLILISGHHRAGLIAYPHWRDPGAVKRDRSGKEIDNEHWLCERIVTGAFENLVSQYNNVHLLDFTYNLTGKIAWINKHCTKYDCVVEVHANASSNKDVTGSEVFHVKNGRRSKTYAERISKIISEKIGTQNRGHKSSEYSQHGRLGIIDDTVSYDFLVELGFLSNDIDYERMKKNGVLAVTEACKFLLEKIK